MPARRLFSVLAASLLFALPTTARAEATPAFASALVRAASPQTARRRSALETLVTGVGVLAVSALVARSGAVPPRLPPSLLTVAWPRPMTSNDTCARPPLWTVPAPGRPMLFATLAVVRF